VCARVCVRDTYMQNLRSARGRLKMLCCVVLEYASFSPDGYAAT